MYLINNGDAYANQNGVSPKALYTRDGIPDPRLTSVTVKNIDHPVNPSNFSPPDFPDWAAAIPDPVASYGNFSMSWDAPFDESGVRRYKYEWAPDGAISPINWKYISAIAESIPVSLDPSTNQPIGLPSLVNPSLISGVTGNLPSITGIYRFIVYAEDQMGHWSTETGKYKSPPYSIPATFNFSIGSQVHVNSSVGVKMRSAPAGAEQGLGKPDTSVGTILAAPQWAQLTSDGTYYLWWNVQWRDGTQGWSAGDSLVAGAPPAVASVPAILSGGSVAAVVGTAFTYTINATNSPTSYTAVGLPAGLSVNKTTGVISGTPAIAGTSSVALTASNAAGSASASLTISITSTPVVINLPGIAGSVPITGQVGSILTYQVVASNSPSSYGATGLPPGLGINSSTGLISGTPTTAGYYMVSLSATNGAGTGTGTLSIAVASVYLGPGEISAVTPSNNTTNQPLSVTLNWAASNSGGGILRYDIYVVKAATDNFFANNLVSQGQTTTSFQVSNLPYNTPVSWGVRAIDPSGADRYSQMFHFTTQAYTTIPTGSVTINSGAATTTSYSVTLNITANAPVSGVQQYMRFSNDGTHWGDWQLISSMFPWNLADPNYGGVTGKPTYTVYAQLRDDQGNQSITYSGSIGKVAGTVGNIILNGAYYQTIQDAINAANPGDTVYLTEGVFTISSPTYPPNSLYPQAPCCYGIGLAMRPGISLKGAGQNKTSIIIQNAAIGLIDADNSIIEGLDIVNSSSYSSTKTVLLVSSSSRLRNCKVRGAYYGIQVGWDAQHAATSVEISDNLVVSNSRGIFITGNASNILIINNTIAYNSPDAAVVAEDGSTTSLRNNIIAFNGVGIGAWASTALSMSNNDVYPNASGVGYNSGIQDQTGKNGNISSDPLFVNPAAGNYQLSASSPAVNAGTYVGVPFNSSAPDMGAFELNATGSIQVNSNQSGASFVVSGPQGNYSGSGKSWSMANLPSGLYSIAFSGLSSLYSPAYQVIELFNGQTVSIDGSYKADTTPPVGTISVNFDEYATDDPRVSVTLDIVDSVGGMGSGSLMQFSNDGVTWSTAESYSSLKKGWDISFGYGGNNSSGLKTVYARVSDVLGNWATFSDSVLFVPNRKILNVPAQYSTIQAAVSAAQPGDVVSLAQGNYGENVVLRDGITLRGGGGDKTIFSSFSTITAAANSQIEGVGGYLQIYVSVGPAIVQRNVIKTGSTHISVSSSERAIIRNNVLYHSEGTFSGVGVSVSGLWPGAKDVVVENNSFTNLSTAIYVDVAQPSTKVINRNNIFYSNSLAVRDSNSDDSTHKHIFSSFNTYWGSVKGNFGELDPSYKSYYALMESGDINADPLFINSSLGDFHLQTASTSANSGNPGQKYADLDLSRNDRGAYGGPNATIQSPPSFLVQPSSQFAAIGSSVTLSGKLVGGLPLSYQWYKDGSAIPSAIGTSLAIGGMTLSDVGVYMLSVSNQQGSSVSDAAYLAPSPRDNAPSYLLSVTGGNGLVSVSPSLSGYVEGSFVTLTAASRPGYQFVSWGGDVSSQENKVVTIMNGNKSIIANYSIALTLDNSSLVFSDQIVSTPSSSRSVKISNTSGSTVTISAVSATNDFAVLGNTCIGALAVGASCTIGVTFIPSAVGSRTGSLNIVDNATGSPHGVSLSGTGTLALYSLTVTNAGNGTVVSSPVGINCGGACSTSFTSGTPITLTATPSTGYSFSGWAGACGGFGNCSFNIGAALSVSASFGVLAPVASFNPTSLSFSSQPQGTTSSAQSVTLSNTGTAVLDISTITSNSDFSQVNNCGSHLSIGGNCTINVSFTPKAAGSRNGTVLVVDNADKSPQMLGLSGIGQNGASGAPPLNTTLVGDWNLLGNGSTGAVDVAGVFGDATKVKSVWKWVSGAAPTWAFYSPEQADGGVAYAHDKGYQTFASVNAGEGFWVNAKQAFSVSLGAGSLHATDAFRDGSATLGGNPLPKGWSLIAVGDNPTPRIFSNAISAVPPTAGTLVATSVTTLWAWHAGDAGQQAGWLYYSPSLDNANGLVDYISIKGYKDFGNLNKTLDPTTGFWVNHP